MAWVYYFDNQKDDINEGGRSVLLYNSNDNNIQLHSHTFCFGLRVVEGNPVFGSSVEKVGSYIGILTKFGTE